MYYNTRFWCRVGLASSGSVKLVFRHLSTSVYCCSRFSIGSAVEKARFEVSEKWNERGIVFANKYGGFLRPDTVLDTFRKLLKDASLPSMRFHDLRHSAATILFVAGVNPKVIQELLGHSKISITLEVYSHVLPSMQQEAAGKMDEVFKRPL